MIGDGNGQGGKKVTNRERDRILPSWKKRKGEENLPKAKSTTSRDK